VSPSRVTNTPKPRSVRRARNDTNVSAPCISHSRTHAESMELGSCGDDAASQQVAEVLRYTGDSRLSDPAVSAARVRWRHRLVRTGAPPMRPRQQAHVASLRVMTG
jgi:hypothetical protein